EGLPSWAWWRPDPLLHRMPRGRKALPDDRIGRGVQVPQRGATPDGHASKDRAAAAGPDTQIRGMNPPEKNTPVACSGPAITAPPAEEPAAVALPPPPPGPMRESGGANPPDGASENGADRL